ncbi:hypothetical protein AVW11_13465 [Streptomyces amritsarensis]|uniref:Uncharacterized protein n=1 Tax=Streptomyces amritsarensis TaxID=681158 RepID=A0ABX3G468_9ACTN|nr:hypothetical protein [Streptomyces amritsarensis]OLZ67965.1 hypothetical protein AVW11_13465 [Streptomyces amritsarensis]
MPVPAQLREAIREEYARSEALLEEERFAPAAEVLGEIIEPAALAVAYARIAGPTERGSGGAGRGAPPGHLAGSAGVTEAGQGPARPHLRAVPAAIHATTPSTIR